MKRFSKFVVLAAIISAMFVLQGALAAGSTVAGEVVGNVAYINGPGLRLDGTCTNQEYQFDGVKLTGTIILSNGKSFSGTITPTGVTGKSNGCETLNGGNGSVNSLTSQASFTGSGSVGSVSGNFYGTYTRTSSVVVVNLTASVTISGTTENNVTIIVRAQFIPNKVNPSTGCIEQAAFAGGFSSN